ncbi:succinate dehydrogenase subunit 4, mitochondrial-like [Phragmites australis]|uniref:succinate dehydrogenase subunit 4, mitochondrial-like n=1 Tax=Phragmites australis TaxID=29695 RepID=UPI002D79B854|nr:succinate dehydrogenase subunit 4, mitochondrial-like [Phragmites australis]
MASRTLTRSRFLALGAALSRAGADAAPPLAGARALSSLPRYPAPSSPAAGSPLGKVLGYEPTSHIRGTQFLPRWFSTVASNGSPLQKSQISETHKSVAEMGQSVAQNSREGATPKVVAHSPLEAAIAKPRSGPLTSESSKVRRSEIATQVTFYMIPALLLASRNSISTSLLVGAVFHQVYMFHKEIFLDYVHHDITRKWALIYFKLLLLVMAKDTITYFNLF